jgi:hypothetical protein
VGGARNPATRSRKAIGDKPGVILDYDAGVVTAYLTDKGFAMRWMP